MDLDPLYKHGAATSRYIPKASDMGYNLRATVGYTDGHGPDKSAQSAATDTVTTCPTVTGPRAALDYAENDTLAVAIYTETSDCGSITWTLDGIDKAALELTAPGRRRAAFSSDPRRTTSRPRTAPSRGSGPTSPSFRCPPAADPARQRLQGHRQGHRHHRRPGARSRIRPLPLTVRVTDVPEPGEVSLSSSTPRVGQAVTATLSDPDGGVTGTDTTWQWQAYDSSLASWDDLTSSDASTNRYTPKASDVGSRLRATVSYMDVHGPDSSASAPTDAVRPSGPTPPNPPSGPRSVSYAENRTDPVATYTLPAPGVRLHLEGTDAASFRVSGDTLFFQSAPDFEAPRNNVYEVSLRNHDGSQSSTTSLPVTVTVTNVDEAGTVSLSSSTPQESQALTATLSDPDRGVSATTWRWLARTDSSAWDSLTSSDAYSSTYTPKASDVGAVLRATVSYADHHGSGKRAESDTTAPVTACVTVSGPYSVSQVEETLTVATFTATSECGSTSWSWSLAGKDSLNFAISDGRLAFVTEPDFESPADADTNTSTR